MRLRHVLFAVSLFLVALVPFAAQVQTQAQDDPTPTVTREVETSETEITTTADDDEESDDGGSFLPTEKINVDSSVSFPVDI